MRWAIVLLGLVACGRLHFDERSDGQAPRDAGPVGSIGCADGEREGFDDTVRFPQIAACAATWAGTPSLRALRTGGACGDDLGSCAVPADACAGGWHVCADTGNVAELSARMTAAECMSAGAPGELFVAASGHCTACTGTCTDPADCLYALPYDCAAGTEPCKEPVCCGGGCQAATSTLCTAAVFPMPNTLAGADMQGCGALAGTTQTGVLCCAD